LRFFQEKKLTTPNCLFYIYPVKKAYAIMLLATILMGALTANWQLRKCLMKQAMGMTDTACLCLLDIAAFKWNDTSDTAYYQVSLSSFPDFIFELNTRIGNCTLLNTVYWKYSSEMLNSGFTSLSEPPPKCDAFY
jgi:hypothetical protein